MIEIPTSKGSVTIWSSVKELPVGNFRDLNKYALIKMGKGNTIQDLTGRFHNLNTFIAANKSEEALQELANLWEGMNDSLNQVDSSGLMFACLVHKVNETVISDYSEDGLLKTFDLCSDAGLTVEKMDKHLKEVKKKLIQN